MSRKYNVVYLGDLIEVFECLAARENLSVRAWVIEPGELTPLITRTAAMHGASVRIADSSSDILQILQSCDVIDLGVIANFGIILGGDCLIVPKQGFVNLHMGLLPEFAGRRPIQKVVDTGAPFAGVTLHRVTEVPDAGPVIESRKIARSGAGVEELFERLKRLSVEILDGRLQELLRGG